MKTLIQLNDFKREYKALKTEINAAIKRVLQSGWYILGPEGEAFEKEMAAYLGVKYCVAVGNGTDAITLALIAQGVGEGDEVITTNLTAFPTITGITRSGAQAVTADIDPHTGLINPAEIEKLITKKTKAIVPVHLYGQMCDIKPIMAIARKYNLIVVEDCAQAIGARQGAKTAGTIGTAGCLSFYPTKNLGAFGDGGAVITNSKQVYQKLLMLRNYGQRVRYYHDEQGINSRLDELQAAILRVKLKHLPNMIERRREIARFYDTHLKNID
ncbi:DegT/DnrJ/EryC1/StrS family aminotransferase, partial [Candidatus Roizmanbacteria bacterium]|nr:DegT/DnrJ/EryC1/StrS family aminotransferase [Candidatus Roizmanbacteria bacterium]